MHEIYKNLSVQQKTGQEGERADRKNCKYKLKNKMVEISLKYIPDSNKYKQIRYILKDKKLLDLLMLLSSLFLLVCLLHKKDLS